MTSRFLPFTLALAATFCVGTLVAIGARQTGPLPVPLDCAPSMLLMRIGLLWVGIGGLLSIPRFWIPGWHLDATWRLIASLMAGTGFFWLAAIAPGGSTGLVSKFLSTYPRLPILAFWTILTVLSACIWRIAGPKRSVSFARTILASALSTCVLYAVWAPGASMTLLAQFGLLDFRGPHFPGVHESWIPSTLALLVGTAASGAMGQRAEKNSNTPLEPQKQGESADAHGA